MAIVSNTYRVSDDSPSIREELSGVVSRISPEETPIYSMIEKNRAASTNPEWLTDELEATGANAQLEGDEYTFEALSEPERLGNHTQIYRKSFIISGSQEKVVEAGEVMKRRYQKLKKGIAIRKDVEASILHPTVSKAGASRQSGGLPTWIKTNDLYGSSGVQGGFNSSTKLTTAPTAGTQRALTKALVDELMRKVYETGAMVRTMMVSPFIKSTFVSIMVNATTTAQFRYATGGGKKNTVVGTADVYEGPYGKVTVIPNRVMTSSTAARNKAMARNVWFLDRKMLCWKWFRKIHEDTKVAKTGDANKCVILGEGCLQVKNEKGLGVIADINGLGEGV